MTNEDLDRILSRHQNIVPSANFVATVMRGVERDAATPPIPFPWTRAVPGLAAWVFVILWFLDTSLLHLSATETVPGTVAIVYAYFVTAAETIEAGWISLSLLLSLCSLAFSLWLTGRRTSLSNVLQRL